MRKSKKSAWHVKKLAMFMIALALSITFQMSFAFAALTKIEAYGNDGVLDVIEETDSIKFKATASITGDTEITPNQLILGGLEQFTTCTKVGDNFVCEAKYPQNGTTSFDPRAIPYTISLRSDANSIVDEKSGVIVVDNTPPTLESIAADLSTVGSGNVRFSYTVSDSSCGTSSCLNRCAGVNKIELTEIGKGFAQSIPVSNVSCLSSGFFDIASSKFTDGEHVIVAKAHDRLGLVSFENAVTFTLDKSIPVIEQASLKIVDETTFDLSYVGPKAVSATLKIDIRDTNLDLNSIRADLSEFGASSNISGQCVKNATSNLASCSWPFTLKANDGGTKKVTIEAKDATGNFAKATLIKEMIVDNGAPTVQSLESASVMDGTSFVKNTGNTIIGRFLDKAGMSASKAILKADGQTYSANSCVPEGNFWKCTWENVNFAGSGSKTIAIEDVTKDRVGNELASRFSKEVIVDTQSPILKNLTVKGMSPSNVMLVNVTKTGDSIIAEAYLEDDFISGGLGDFSRYIIGSNGVSAQCSKISNKNFRCVWQTEPINVNGYISSTTDFTFKDSAGNQIQKSVPFTVHGTDDSIAEFWSSTVSCSPEAFDRQTFDLINHRSYCHVHLAQTSFSGNIRPVSITVGPCQGDVGWIETIRIHNNQQGSTDPYLEVIFKKQAANVNEINIVCPLNVVTKKDNNIVTTAEKEQIAIHFEFYNSPMGEVSASVQEKIDGAVESATGLLSYIGTLKKIVFYAQQICNFLALFKQVVNLFYVMKALIDSNPATAVASQAYLTNYMCNSVEQLKEKDTYFMRAFNRFCGYVNCKYSPPWDASQGEANKPYDFEKEGGWLGWMNTWEQGGWSMLNTVGFNIQGWTGIHPSRYMNPKDSIVVATMTACIPGIIHGIDKYRQIQCMYADCLMSGVGQNGIPVYVCEDQKNYATCKYVVGEVFNVIPFTALFNYYITRIKRIVSDPFEVLGVALAYGCRLMCNPASGGHPYNFCIAPKIAQMITSSIQDVAGLLDGTPFTMPGDYCSNLEEKIEEQEAAATTT